MDGKVPVIVTSINEPTEAVRKLSARRDVLLIVIGDNKTPDNWHCDGAIYLDVASQMRRFPYARVCPLRSYARKNVGYLEAVRRGFTVIAETDDDNIPYDDFATDLQPSVLADVAKTAGWVNPYVWFTKRRVWPRGLPLTAVNESLDTVDTLSPPEIVDAPIQQYLADGDPDVDAIYRLTNSEPTYFDKRSLPVALGPMTCAPFNSQNTIFWSWAFPLLYLPSQVSIRVTDIWRSFVAARCVAAAKKSVLFGNATVVQLRNDHSLMRDFEDELPGYRHNDEIRSVLWGLDLDDDEDSVSGNLVRCYEALVKIGVVPESELSLLDMWLSDLTSCRDSASPTT